jgi:hypothetical protein
MVTAQFGDALASSGLREIQRPEIAEVVAAPADPLGPRAQLAGPWEGAGFNAISCPNDISHGGQDRFLDLNITEEKLSFIKINAPIPVRGLLIRHQHVRGRDYTPRGLLEKTSGPR